MGKQKKLHERLDPKDAMAAVLGGCNGVSYKHARRRVDWMLETGSDEHRKKLEQALDAWQRSGPSGLETHDLATQREILRAMGQMMARLHRKAGKRPPCDDPVGRSKMLRIAQVFFSSKKIETTFIPLVGHYIEEFEAARPEGWVKMLCVKVEWWGHFLFACGFAKWVVVIDLIAKLARLVVVL